MWGCGMSELETATGMGIAGASIPLLTLGAVMESKCWRGSMVEAVGAVARDGVSALLEIIDDPN